MSSGPVVAATDADAPHASAVPPTGVLSAEAVAAVHRWLIDAVAPADAAGRIDVLRALEELSSAVSAAQASVALAVDEAVRAEEAAAGVPAERRGRDVAARVGLALRVSPARARSFLGAARVWQSEMPCTWAALRAGVLSSWRATLLVKETAHLPVEARAQVDAVVCGDLAALEGVGTRALVGTVKAMAARLDPAAVAERARRAASERSVWLRPAPDTMTYLTALLPVAQGVAAYAALRAAADTAVATGDHPGDAGQDGAGTDVAPRSRGQVMADTLVERLTGQATVEAVPVLMNLVVSDATLLGAGHEPGVLTDVPGDAAVVPGQVARNLVAAGLDADAAWLRRIYTDPTGQLVGASSSQRFFASGLAGLLRARDQGLCRTPYCDAPIRHLDHITPAADGGPTTLTNGQGLCEACNHAKTTGALAQTVLPDPVTGRHTVVTTTPTGHAYVSTAPPPPRPAEPAPASRAARPEREPASPSTPRAPARTRPPARRTPERGSEPHASKRDPHGESGTGYRRPRVGSPAIGAVDHSHGPAGGRSKR